MSNKHRIAGRILIFGGGGHAREIECLAKDIFAAHAGGEVVAFVERDDSPQLGSFMHGVPIITSSEAVRRFGDVPFVVAIGDPRVRQEVTGHALASGLIPTILVHPSVVMSETVMLGPGTVVCAGCIFTCDIKVGAHVHVNRASLISHDVTIGDYATLSPGVRISGNVRIGSLAFLGVGATIVDGTSERQLTIGDGAIVGAQACVLADVAPDQTVVGVPARPIPLHHK